MKLGRMFAKVREGSLTALDSCPHHRLLVVTNWPGCWLGRCSAQVAVLNFFLQSYNTRVRTKPGAEGCNHWRFWRSSRVMERKEGNVVQNRRSL